MIAGFEPVEAIINQNRDARELDITVEEARSRKLVNGNETYIGRRVIDTNIARDKPTFLRYLTGSPRQIVLRTADDTIPVAAREHLEREFTNGFRTGGWLGEHIKAVDSMQLHGRGIFLVTANAESPLGIAASYVPPEDFVFPLEVRDLQSAPMLAIRYKLTVTQFEDWAQRFQWKPAEVKTIVELIQDDARVKTILFAHHVIFRVPGGQLYQVWYYNDTSRLLSVAAPYFGGFLNEDRTPRPTSVYPVFPVYLNVTENPKLVERKGRAHADMHDQEALTVSWTSVVNAAIRASEIYPYRDDAVPVENPEVVQTDTILRPGVVTKTKLQFFAPPAPNPMLLTVIQALRTENSSAAGQVDFAAQTRKDSRKTATELDLAADQSSDIQAGPLTSFAIGYRELLQYMWDVVVNNLQVGALRDFLSHPDDAPLRAALTAPAPGPDGASTLAPATRFTVVPAGDVDYVERQKKLQRLVQFFPLYQQTPAAEFFLQRILELAFPDDYPQLAPLLQDKSKNMGVALLHILEALPPGAVPPEQAQQFQQIIAEAQQVFGTGPGPAAPPNAPNNAAAAQ